MAVAAPANRVLRFGAFQLNVATGELRKSDIRLKLRPQAAKVLVALVTHAGETITRDQLKDQVWGNGLFVDFEHGLNVCIRQIRAVLDDDPDKPRYIETIPRHGYRFIARVEEVIPGLILIPDSAVPNSTSSAELRTDLIKRESGRATSLHRDGTPSSGVSIARPALLPRIWTIVTTMAALAIVALIVWWVWSRERPLNVPTLTQRRLTNNSPNAAVLSGVISPDGNYLAYSDPAGIHIQLVDSGEVRTIALPSGTTMSSFSSDSSIFANTTGTEWYVSAWFPDGTRFVVNSVAAITQRSSAWIVSTLGGAFEKVHDDAFVTDVSANGSELLFLPKFSFSQEAWVMLADGEQPHKLFSVGPNASVVGAAWSEDGESVCDFVREQNVPIFERATSSTVLESGVQIRARLELRSLDGARPRVLIADPRLTDAVCLPTHHVAYLLTESDPGRLTLTSSLWDIEFDSSFGRIKMPARRVMDWAGFSADSLTASRSGKRVSFRRHFGQFGILMGDLQAGGAKVDRLRTITSGDVQDLPAAWTADSKSIVFISDRNGGGIYKVDSELQMQLITRLVGNTGPTRLSPDGKWVIFTSMSSGPPRMYEGAESTARILRAPVDGGVAVDVVNHLLPFESFRCTRAPATFCVFPQPSADGHQIVLFSFDPIKGSREELVRLDLNPYTAHCWDISPNGQAIAFFTPGEDRIHLLNLADRRSTILKAQDWGAFTGAIDWSSDGKGLFIDAAATNRAAILFVDLQGRAHVLWEHPRGMLTWAIPSPDGRHLAILSSGLNSNMWLIDNF